VDRASIALLCFLALALAVLFAPFTSGAATFNCTIRTSCNANETVLIRLNSSESANTPNNSHAQLANFSGTLYPYAVCCWSDSFRTLNNTCGGNGVSVLRLNWTNDSHVEAGNMSTNIYPYKACLNATSGNISCEYPTSACGAGYSPVVSIASSEAADVNLTNAHVSDFGLYTRKVCCQIGGQNPPYVNWVNISPNGTATTRQDLECQNGTTGDADGDTVTLHYNWYLNGTSITLLDLPMDFDGTKTHDFSGYKNDGTVNGAAFLPTGGQVGGAFSFDGTARSVAITDKNYFSPTVNNMTIALWARVLSNAPAVGDGVCGSGGAYFITKGGTGGTYEWGLENDNNARTCISLWTNVGGYHGEISKAMTVNDDQWHHYAVTLDYLNNLTLYIDGAQANSSASFSSTMTDTANDILIGRRGDTGSYYFNGSIDEVILFNRTLTPSEIATLYATNNRWLNHTELRRGNNWNCSITPVDSTGLNGTTKYSNITNITGAPPLNVTLLYPLNNNQTVFERFVNFSWSQADEPDGDQVNYTLVANVTPGLCGAQVNITNTTTNYTYGELCVDQLYNWTVKACDIDGCSNWSGQFNFTIASVVSIKLNNNNTNFGALAPGQSKDTEAGGVAPFVLENNGNVFVNVTLLGNNSPYSTVALNTSAFQYKARANESGAFPAASAQTTYTPVNSTYGNLVKQFNYTDISDDAIIDINITVPPTEPPGYKEANITFSAGRWNTT